MKTENELDLLEVPRLILPCDSARTAIENHGSRRFMSLSKIPAIKDHCKWCGTSFESKGLKPHHLRLWCSSACARTAQHHCFPQDPGSKMRRLIFNQHFACKMCGESYEDEIRALIKRRWEVLNEHNLLKAKIMDRKKPKTEKVTLHYVGYNTGDRWQTDHIIPIHKGGKGIDPDNLQVICVPCHKAKTIDDRRFD